MRSNLVFLAKKAQTRQAANLISVEPSIDGLAAISPDTGGIARLRDEVRLHRVEQAVVVELHLAELQEILAG